ncbi:unnamed protein product [Arctogadus glacialis]
MSSLSGLRPEHLHRSRSVKVIDSSTQSGRPACGSGDLPSVHGQRYGAAGGRGHQGGRSVIDSRGQAGILCQVHRLPTRRRLAQAGLLLSSLQSVSLGCVLAPASCGGWQGAVGARGGQVSKLLARCPLEGSEADQPPYRNSDNCFSSSAISTDCFINHNRTARCLRED